VFASATRREVTRHAGAPRTSFFLFSCGHPSRVLVIRFEVFSPSAAFKRARRGPRCCGRRVEPAARRDGRHPRGTSPASATSERRDTVPSPGRPPTRVRGIFSAEPRVPTTRVADGVDVVHPPPILRVPPIALNAARIDSHRARRPLNASHRRMRPRWSPSSRGCAPGSQTATATATAKTFHERKASRTASRRFCRRPRR
jgi:hypothetical protein